MRKYIKLFSILGILGFLACTDEQCAELSEPMRANVKCYSTNGTLISEGQSRGKVKKNWFSHIHYFRDNEGRLRETGGHCVITYKKEGVH